MIKFVHLVMAVLASWRITELFVHDRVTEKLRTKFPHYVWQCIRCMSVWAGFAVTFLFIYFPWGNWPFAFAWIYLWHMDAVMQKRIFNKGRRFKLEVMRDGTYNVDSEFSEAELQQILTQMLVTKHQTGQPN